MSVFVLMKKLGILNFIVVQVELETFDKLTVWTKNQFTNHENYFVSDHRPVAHFFPDKLHNLNGYQFVLHGDWDYPYIMPYADGVYGVLPKFIDIIIREQCNGTISYSQDTKHIYLADLRYNEQELRLSFMHTIYFREQSGWYLVCPERKERDFLQPLLKPFSMGIWIVLGALYVTCRVLQFLFPTTYRYDLVGITFFGGGGTEYEHPFQFRIVTFTLIVLLFFLSEAYNTKLISLMTFSKFFKQPETLEEFVHTDYRILAVPSSMELTLGLKHNFLSLSETRREERRLGPRRNEIYCSIMSQGIAYTVVGIGLENYAVPLYMIPEPVIVDRFLVQFNQHSPFYELFQIYFDRFNDAGLWINLFNRHMHALGKVRPHLQGIEQFQEVIFYFDDLTCIWILVIAGWFASAFTFVGEVIWWKIQNKFLARNTKSEQIHMLFK
ncbi:hypothetical protein ZHAS_00013754 [Anopheles sinensis]|uniref:Ionotropic glutamate receptor L-glutamate and glycine-binding domain-containing protein n=1 Tax=Anopheles sinensis TaxID=74873 RepID=A0A084W6D4_ANOSI|nr:hypothetical protein ZHAS_00013754 [Anopheles sinensis]